MTIGQRIAQNRKELGLSQEALGDQLGVSRQSIYKWESDSALPEIDKLIALSRLFGVSVGALLGVEEEPAPEPEGVPTGELTEQQLKMVEEIVARYLAAQPKPMSPKRRKLFKVAVAISALCLVVVLYNLSGKLDRLNNQYNNLQNSVSNVSSTVNSQINGISNRVEEILKAQNALTAEYGTEIFSTDPEINRIHFSVYATPKTYVEGMEVKFFADSHTDTDTVHSTLGAEGVNQNFSSIVATELTDSITLSATFIYPDGTQVLDTYEGLFSASLPGLRINEYHLFAEDVVNGTLKMEDLYATTQEERAKSLGGASAARIADVKLGVFRNQKLLGWAAPCEQPGNYHGDYTDQQFYRLPDLTIENLTEDDKLYIAALVTDTYGRQFMACDIPYVVEFDTDRDYPYLTYPSSGAYDSDPNNWIFE